ncbi:N2227-like protein [Jimgerdemannia flammicorona]|uniref:carnosine N-methyltransferase n=1 Tax=Jimgerdemannia flammicorona TaxID=994334 RepID=A0A433CVS7_9FUNG|nr:N2227-like protein [Jimgerdemannia flammicorona]
MASMSRVRQYAIYPFIHSFSNIRRSADQLRPVMIPDVLPGDLPPGAAFSMVAGDFLDVYGQGKENFVALLRSCFLVSAAPERWDVVVTCYFIDTAKNIMEYMEVIRRALKPGGVWINIGPLLYHFENSPGEFSIELSLEEVKDVACKLGFRFETESMVAATYTSNPDTMLRYQYECAYWTAVKEWSDSDAGIYYVHDVDDDEDEELEEGA